MRRKTHQDSPSAQYTHARAWPYNSSEGRAVRGAGARGTKSDKTNDVVLFPEYKDRFCTYMNGENVEDRVVTISS